VSFDGVEVLVLKLSDVDYRYCCMEGQLAGRLATQQEWLNGASEFCSLCNLRPERGPNRVS
jgi:hypothetical protein